MIAPEIVFQVPGRGAARNSLREAQMRRAARARRMRHAGMLRIVTVTAVVVILMMAYLAVVANMTGTNTALNTALEQKAQLLEETMRYDDEIAKIESRERLSSVAASLKMARTSDFLVVSMPHPAASLSHFERIDRANQQRSTLA